MYKNIYLALMTDYVSGKNYISLIDRLINTELKDIDPYSKDLTDEQKADIIKECKSNIIYFLTKIARIPHYNDDSVPFEFNVLTFLSSIVYENYTNTMYIRGQRQSGQTTLLLLFAIYDYLFKNKYATIIHGKQRILFNHDLEDKFEQLIHLLPNYILENEGISDGLYSERIAYVDDAECLDYERYTKLRDTFKRIVFCGTIFKDADPLLIRKFETDFVKINYKSEITPYDDLMISFHTDYIFGKNRVCEMEKLLDDPHIINRELYLIRC